MHLFARRFQRHLSIAHCVGLVAVALSEARIGVDCEACGRQRRWLKIAEQFFSDGEFRSIARAPTSSQERLFLRHWVLKEAYIKAIRGSVFGDLNRLQLTGNNRVLLMAGEASEGASARIYESVTHQAALFCETSMPPQVAIVTTLLASTDMECRSISAEDYRSQRLGVGLAGCED